MLVRVVACLLFHGALLFFFGDALLDALVVDVEVLHGLFFLRVGQTLEVLLEALIVVFQLILNLLLLQVQVFKLEVP